jgi:RHS repeat-associated protein
LAAALPYFLTLVFFLAGVIFSRADYTVTTTSTKGWSKTETFNNLGLATNSALTGTGIPSATLIPTWRVDGSLSGVSFTVDGETHSATFKNDGTLNSLTGPNGTIPVTHAISSGVETLTVDGITSVTNLDGTKETVSGGDVIGKIDELTISGSGFNHATTPAVGAATNVALNAAGAPTGKSYAAGPGVSFGYQDELLSTVSLARGGNLALGYSNDGAKDLTAAEWPTVASGPFTIPSILQTYDYDRAGRIDGIGDASGARAIVYQNGRHKQTAWNSGPLAGYKIVKGFDTNGRDTGFELWRGNVMVHSAIQAPNGVSGEVSEIVSGNRKIVIDRNAARQLTGFRWGNASGAFVSAVSQRWQRGAGGRILLADNAGPDTGIPTVPGAPTFNYKGTANNEATAFDSKGRRLKCVTTGGEWSYTYTNGRLTSAIHPTLGSFTYQFDAIGRRKGKGPSGADEPNTTDLLNRTLAWTNSQNKTIKIAADPAAQVSFNGTPVLPFTGSYSYAVPSPGVDGGWFAWNTLAFLPGQGDAGANPDAKAEQSGAVWVPPIDESFTYDNAGNRESSALWNYGWNAKNQLVRARTKNYNNPSTPQGYDISNDYDAEGRRFSKKVKRYQSGAIVEQNIITIFHDGNDPIYERHQLPSGLTTLERKYIWGPDISGTHGGAGGAGGLLLIRETKGNTTTDLYPLYDGNGNVIALADSTGTLQAEYAYGPFGELLYARGPNASSCPFRFQTKYYDQETGLYNFGIRFLDPITGQWTSRDPLGEKESLNLYDLTGGDPINKVDVNGLWEINTQEAANNQRVEWLLMQLSAGSGLPTAPPDEWKLYFPERGDFGLYKPYGPEDYKNAQTFVQNLGRPSLRASTWEEAEAARQPSFGPAPEWIPSATAALPLGAANTPLNASLNSDWLLPTGAGTAGAKFLFGGMKAMLPVLAAGARVEGKVLTTELQVGEMFTANAVKEGPSLFARSQQGSGAYLGIDRWRDITLKKRTIIYGGEPGQSAFYTTGSALRRTGDSATSIFQGLQVARHRIHGYRPRLTAYEVIDDIPAAFGRTLANPQHGAGGLPQLVIPNFKTFLRPIYTTPLSP